MAAKDRLQTIKQMVTNEKKVLVTHLSQLFQVTEETIRRDLEKLEAEGIITRTYGGAVLNSASITDNVHFYKRAKSFFEEKQVIALNALPFINNKTTMSADSSTTAMELLKLLKDRKDLTLLTNSTEAFRELAQSDINIVSTGASLIRIRSLFRGVLPKKLLVNTMSILW